MESGPLGFETFGPLGFETFGPLGFEAFGPLGFELETGCKSCVISQKVQLVCRPAPALNPKAPIEGP